MEKTSRGIVIPLDAGWSDIGSWEAVWETSNKDHNGNFIEGNIVLENTKNSFLRSEHRLIVGIDLNNIVVVETRDAILISEKNSSQKVKNIVNQLKKNNIPEEAMAAPTNSMGGGAIAGSVEAGDNPPVKKKKRYIYGGTGSRRMWMKKNNK